MRGAVYGAKLGSVYALVDGKRSIAIMAARDGVMLD